MNDTEKFLADWDVGRPVTTVSMGGLSDGYEQCIHIMAMEYLRALIDWNEEYWNLPDIEAETLWNRIERAAEDEWEKQGLIGQYGPSGAQVGAAKNLAAIIFRKGYDVALADDAIKDRKITMTKRSIGNPNMKYYWLLILGGAINGVMAIIGGFLGLWMAPLNIAAVILCLWCYFYIRRLDSKEDLQK